MLIVICGEATVCRVVIGHQSSPISSSQWGALGALEKLDVLEKMAECDLHVSRHLQFPHFWRTNAMASIPPTPPVDPANRNDFWWTKQSTTPSGPVKGGANQISFRPNPPRERERCMDDDQRL